MWDRRTGADSHNPHTNAGGSVYFAVFLIVFTVLLLSQ